ncbi:PspC domain-containing protein [Solirubrobacter soli]|uniref:PspC domain-containing protein n=1 Tax=Solirubrobacter soli TaxID=363832 RepID=UPI000A03FDA3|nr:PspC domain-containing protein [Solirubrobacter soli]
MPPTGDDPQMVPQDPLPGPEDVPGARKLTRSTTDKHVWGVAGGLGRYFGIDPVIVRVAFAAATLVSGIGLIAYVALRLLLPTDTGEPPWMEGRSRTTTIIVTGVLSLIALTTVRGPGFFIGPGLFAVAACSVAGLVLYRGFGGTVRDDPARAIARATLVLIALVAMLGAATGIGLIAAIGGGVAVAIIAICAGLGLVAAGMLGGPRWLILPVVVLVLPLAVVSAADIDLRGGVGEREIRPATVADLQPQYKLGVGHLDLDLRRIELPARTTQLNVKLGMGEARVRVPAGTCVVTDAKIGVGAADLPERAGQGFDIAIDHGTAGMKTLKVNADIGVGHLLIDNAERCT